MVVIQCVSSVSTTTSGCTKELPLPVHPMFWGIPSPPKHILAGKERERKFHYVARTACASGTTLLDILNKQLNIFVTFKIQKMSNSFS